MTEPTKRLYRSREDRIFGGIFGGLGNYFNIDSVLLRLIWVVLFVITGGVPGIVIYIFALFIVPLEPEKPGAKVYEMPAEEAKPTSATTEDKKDEKPPIPPSNPNAW